MNMKETKAKKETEAPALAVTAKKPIYKNGAFLAVCAALVLTVVIIAVVFVRNGTDSDADVVKKIEDSTTVKSTYKYDYDSADIISDGINPTTWEAAGAEETSEPEAPVIKKGQKITIDGICQFNIDYTDVTKKVVPKNPERYYRYYEAEKGMTYVDICIAYKNLESSAVMADDVGSAVMYYDNNYEYKSFSCIEEDNRGSFTYSNITSIDPLTTEYLHYIFEVPDEVVKSGKSMVVYLSFGEDNIYRINIK